jgi:SAM-dependent methyltransferase
MTDLMAKIRRSEPAAEGRDARKCPVCGSADTKRKTVTNRHRERRLLVRTCGRCGHVAVLNNFHDYTESQSVEDLGVAPRCGTLDRPGREFGMAKMAVDVLARNRIDVLVYGAGRSLDNVHIAELPQVRRVAVGDIMQVRDDVDFIDTSKPASETFDVVVACEVIEHFVKPREDFASLFRFVHRSGILVCSTNIYDGGNLNRHGYIFGRGHVSYYTPEALRTIAKANGMYVDFRVPLSATGTVGPRKRYVIFTYSTALMDTVSDYFGREMYAPSEAPIIKRPAKKAVKARQAARRRAAPAAGAAARADKSPTDQG